MDAILPTPSLTPFVAQRLRNARVVYRNSDFPDTDYLEHCAYLVPSELESDEDYLPQRKTFQAERYGGHGLLFHGGGARCGYDGVFQIKGIGVNHLAGEPSAENFWHSHGGLALVDALQEAAWGEVFHHALPYGAVRVRAIMDTGTQCWHKQRGAVRSKALRALVVREPAARPAHFERAVYFRQNAGVSLAPDTQRVREAIGLLPQFLPQSVRLGADDIRKMSDLERLDAGLVEFVRRNAAQLAAAKAQRLMHNTITASNVCLDGRWLDFGTATAMPSYANTRNFGLPFNAPTFWSEQDALHPVLLNLCFYLAKYATFPDEAARPRAEALIQLFMDEFQARLAYAFADLSGVPHEELSDNYTDTHYLRYLKAYAAILIRVARSGVKKPFVLASSAPALMGRNPIADVTLALATAGEASANLLAAHVPAAGERDRLIRAHGALLAVAREKAAARGIDDAALHTLTLANLSKQHYDRDVLHRPSMVKACKELVEASDDSYEAERSAAFQAWIDRIGDEAEVIYAKPRSFVTTTWKKGDEQMRYDARRNAWCHVVSGRSNWLCADDIAARHPWEQGRLAIAAEPLAHLTRHLTGRTADAS